MHTSEPRPPSRVPRWVADILEAIDCHPRVCAYIAVVATANLIIQLGEILMRLVN